MINTSLLKNFFYVLLTCLIFVGVAQAMRPVDSRLIVATQNGDVDQVQAALYKGANPNVKGYLGLTPIHWASMLGHAGVAQVLLNPPPPTSPTSPLGFRREVNGADPNIRDDTGLTSLHNASSAGHLEVVRLLLSYGANSNAIGSMGLPLHLAARNGYAGVVQLLLEFDANPNINDVFTGYTPLHLAVIRGYVDVVQRLLVFGANPNSKDASGQTPLHCVAIWDQLNMVQLLLAFGANLHVKDNFYDTPFFDAVLNDHVEMVQIFLNHMRMLLKECNVTLALHSCLTLTNKFTENQVPSMIMAMLDCNTEQNGEFRKACIQNCQQALDKTNNDKIRAMLTSFIREFSQEAVAAAALIGGLP